MAFTEKDLNKKILAALNPQANLIQKLIQQKRDLDGGKAAPIEGAQKTQNPT